MHVSVRTHEVFSEHGLKYVSSILTYMSFQGEIKDSVLRSRNQLTIFGKFRG